MSAPFDLLLPLLALLLLLLLALSLLALLRRGHRRPTIAFLHPNCLAGGGGERVLWVAVAATARALPRARLVVLAPWPPGDALALARATVAQQFRLAVPPFVPVAVRTARLGTGWRRATLAAQALGEVVLGAEALLRARPHVVVDTANLAFALAPARMARVTTVAYVHYPTVGRVGGGGVRGGYYGVLRWAYGVVGRGVDVAVVNSSWTRREVESVWGVSVATVFPPCDTGVLGGVDEGRTRGMIVSVGQFRPEKEHALQMEVMERLVLDRGGALGRAGVRPRLIMIGGVRGKEDLDRVERLKAERLRRGLDGVVEIRVNASWEEMVGVVSGACVGLHTMRDEHFGISVVELQAAGVVPVAHRSGGVEMDIIEDGVNGLLAEGVDGFCEALVKVLTGEGLERSVEEMRRNGRESVKRFQDTAFAEEFGALMKVAAGKAEARGAPKFEKTD